MDNRQKGPVSMARVKDVAVLTLSNPPLNTLSPAVLADLTTAFDSLALDPAVLAVVLLGNGAFFSAGGDLREPVGAYAMLLRDLCHKIEGFSRPVIAAMPGPALGGGAELALAAHFRLATPKAEIGFPGLTLGMVPTAGATQRLPRIVGADVALRLLLSGRPIPAPAAQVAGLIDGVVNGDLTAGAVAFATGLLAKGKGPRPTRLRRDKLLDGAVFLQAVQQHRVAAVASPVLAAAQIVDCVEAAILLPFATGCAFEIRAFDECLIHPQSVALRHVFLAERQISDQLLTKGPWLVTERGARVVAAMQQALAKAADWLLGQGVTKAQVDATLCAYGFVQGPFGGKVKGALDPVILRRILAALMAEGARHVESGAVAKAADIDALAVHAMGFPRLQGGPMQGAQMLGLAEMRRQMRDWAAQDAVWAVPELLDLASKLAGGFAAIPAKSR